jgi:hypothetical protein
MRRQVIPHDHLTRTQRGYKHLLDKREKPIRLGGGLPRPTGWYAFRGESAQDGEHLPAPGRHRFRHSLPFRRSFVAARPIGTGGAFLDKDQVPGWDAA